MADNLLPSPHELRQLLRYEAETGEIYCARSGAAKLHHKRKDDYLGGKTQGRGYLAHRAAWALHYGSWPQGEIDHINGDRADNRIANLRDVPHTVNSRNMKRFATNTSGATGVIWIAARGVWHARIRVNYKLKHVGTFSTFEEAVAARQEAEKKYGFHENHGRE